MNTPPQRNCPDDEVLQELAAGISSPELAEQTMRHVARCPVCGPALRRYLHEFADERSPENERILAQLQSAKPKWQRQLVGKVSARPQRSRWLKLVPASLALALVVVGIFRGPALMAEFKLHQAQKQAAMAFAGRRTTEMRLLSVDYAPYKPFPIILGGESGHALDEIPPELTSASSAANENLRAGKADPRWLQVQGRALLWESTPSSLEKAEKNFEKARAEGLNTPSLEIDLAASYFERDSKSEHPNLQRTLNLLNEVLSTQKLDQQERAGALYNLAIAYEKTQAWDLAVSTWEKYLQVEPSGQWSNEARQHLKDGKAKIPPSGPAKSAAPGAFLQQFSGGGEEAQIEDYQDVAITAWLPDALEKNDADSWKAVRELASLLVQQHSDPWLEDLLSSVGSRDQVAVRALAIAVQKNGQGDHEKGFEQSERAAEIFALHNNPAGEFRARIEEVDALRRDLNGSSCLARADPLWNRLSRTKYHWLLARLSLERAECGNLLGAFAESDSHLQSSRQIAQHFDFSLLVLRDLGISAGNKHLRGNCNESWRESVDGLSVFWQKAHVSSDRLYQFYSVMFQCALETGSLHAGEALLRHAIEMRETSPDIKRNHTIEGILHLHLANVLLARGATREAEREKQLAASLVDQKGLPPQFELTVKLEPAEFQLEHGDARRALSTLEPLQKGLAENPDRFFSLRFNQALGNTYLKLGQLNDAGEAYRRAIQTSESALDGIKESAERLQWLRATEESYRGLVRVLIEQKRTREALESWESYRGRPMLQEQVAFDGRGHATTQADVKKKTLQVRELNTPEPRIIYADFDDGMHIWILRAGEIKGQWVVVDRQDLETSIREFVGECALEDSSLTDLQQRGTKLFSLMLQPVMAELGPSGTVIVELDRQAYNLPMEALRTPDDRYFGEKYALVYSPGIWTERSLRSPRRVTGQESLLLLDASHAAGSYLPGLDAQRAMLARLFPRTQVIDTAKVKWSDVRGRLALSEVFHYMGHGRPDGSGTSLDYDQSQPLRAKDFPPQLLARSTMVVLAACSGAAGRDNGIADTNNLVHTFLRAGVTSVIASHWNVDSAATSQLMISFYQHLTKSETVAQAMYNARIDILRTNAHPYFWAGFTVAGRAS